MVVGFHARNHEGYLLVVDVVADGGLFSRQGRVGVLVRFELAVADYKCSLGVVAHVLYLHPSEDQGRTGFVGVQLHDVVACGLGVL